MARAAACTSLTVVSVIAASAGLTSTATGRRGYQFTQKSQALGRQLGVEKVDPREIAARPGEARHQTKLDRIFANDEDDRDFRSCRLGRSRRRRPSGRSDHRSLAANQFGHKRRQSIDLILGPAVFDCDVLALDIARVFQALAEPTQLLHVPFGRLDVEEADHRHRRLLRPRRERPRRGRAAERG